jgi:hypothetical protein
LTSRTIAKAKGKSTKKVNTKCAKTKSNNVAYHVDTTPVIVDVEKMSLSLLLAVSSLPGGQLLALSRQCLTIPQLSPSLPMQIPYSL